MTDKFDAQTGRRIHTAVDQLPRERHYLERAERELEEAEHYAALTLWQRMKVPTIVIAISTPITVVFVLISVALHARIDVSGFILGAFAAGITALAAAVVMSERIDHHRGTAARSVVYRRDAVARAARRVENTEQEITTVRRMQEDRAAKDLATPSPEELLTAIVSTASRSTATTERDSLLWGRVAKDPSDDNSWAALAASNSWTPELTAKVAQLWALTHHAVEPPEPEGSEVGWAG